VVAGPIATTGLLVVGVHTPELPFEHDIDGVRHAVEARDIDYPAAQDNDYAVGSAFANHCWPALYFVDADAIIRDHHFGEGRYEQSERVIQRLLGVERERVASRSGSPRATRTSCCRLEPESRFPSACSSTARLRAAHTASTSTRTATACFRDGRLYQLVREHDAVRQRTVQIIFL
jgi:hypothetical protein